MWKISHTCIASIMHVNFKFHMHDKIVSHVGKDFTWNKMHGKKVHTYDKNFSHVLQNFTPISKSSHACEMLMWWTCIFSNIDFTWFLFFTHFSHPFHMIFTHIALVVLVFTNKHYFLRMKINKCITSNNGHVWYFNPFQPIAFCHLCLHETTHKKSETRFQ